MRRRISLRKMLVCLLWLVFVFSTFILMHSGYNSARAEEDAEAVTEAAEDGISEETGIALNGTEIQDAAGGYIRQKMPHPPVFRISRPSGLRLEEPSRNLYIALRDRVSAVAAGEEGSTEFQIPYEEVFTNTFTADDLGISAIVTEERTITPEAKTAAMEAMLRNRSAVHPAEAVICLIYDSPYELYWFDKSEGHGAKASYVTTTYSATTTTITVKGYIQIRMSCSRDYAVMSVSETGEATYAEYEADTRYGTAVQAAAENAAAILNANQGKSDEEKMAAYRDAICALTDYNHEAGEEDPYGDPWQLVWVFDGKPNTKVVCEGYAKAFQYLCDLGTDEATVISVQGRAGGAHMWNIVTTYGHNYLTDLTNYDLGYDLYMKGFTDGDVAGGYTIRHSRGTMKYIYNSGMGRSEEELTLYPMDYSEWKAKVETVPEIQISSGRIYPGYDAAVRVRNEEGIFPVTALIAHRIQRDEKGEITEETREELAMDAGMAVISEAGEYTFTAIRDGKESEATETMILEAAEMPEGPAVQLPAGAEIQAEAFAGNSAIRRVEADGCVIRSRAFAESPVETARLTGECIVENGAFEEDTVLLLDSGSEWTDAGRFLVAQEGSEE